MKWIILFLWGGAIAHIHLRGRVRLPLLRQLADHSSVFAPMNALLHACSAVPQRPFLPAATVAELALLQSRWQTIRDEGLALMALKKIAAAQNNDDAGFNSFFKYGWKRFYLKWYGAQHPSAARLCPQTVALLARLPSVKAAMFAELPPGGHLNLHRDPFAGSLRYHLGLATPNDARCHIDVDGQRHVWHDGEGVLFDETYLHCARNDTAQTRLILFCDVERPMRYRWARALNRWLGRTLVTAAASPNEGGDQVGLISRLFRIADAVGRQRQRLKRWNRPLYQVLRIVLVAAVVFALVKL